VSGVVQVGQVPVPVTPALAVAALDRHLPKVLGGRSLAAAGWRRPSTLTLLVPLTGDRADGGSDDFLVRMGFAYYPNWPPSVLFVNPQTLDYRFPDDRGHLPAITGTNELAVHATFEGVPQLVCCSFVLEFYQVRHGVEPRHLWDPTVHTFAATLNALRQALREPFYQGRQG
jgi:hypothetical protein